MGKKIRLVKLAELSNDLEWLYDVLALDDGEKKDADEVFAAMCDVDEALVHLAKANAAYKAKHGKDCSFVI